MNALAVLVLLLFFILLALSLTVWTAISLGTKRRGLVGDDGPAPARQPRPARAAPLAAQQTTPTTRVEGAAAADRREGRGGRKEPSVQPTREAAEQPWLRPQVVVERQEAESPAAERGRQRQPRVVNSDAGDQRRTNADPAAAAKAATAAQQPARATVTPRAVERDAFDRFLDSERRRD